MRALRWAMVALLAGAILVSALFTRDMNRAYERVRDNGTVISSAFNDIEFTEAGEGVDVLVIHGSGGGYDQGELIAQAVLGDGFHSITPSRFGYLRSSFHAGATWDDQAHAYAHLLDHLDSQQVAVVAMSQGGPSALLFAVLHPDRVSSLTLISCGVVASSTEDQAEANEKGNMLATIFKHDLLYWGISKLFKKQLMGLIGANSEVIADLTPDQRQLFEHFIEYMNPVSPRSAGASFDNKARMPGTRIAAITAPTLILHASDDGLQLYHNAEFAAATIPNATLVRFETGGHFIIGTEQSRIRAAVEDHILNNAGEARAALLPGCS
jgi:pimeloyl-ACP methyl ester carboxylesterase